jgi:hypothetical protein
MARRRREEDRVVDIIKGVGALFIVGLLYRPLFVFLLYALGAVVVVAIAFFAIKAYRARSLSHTFSARVLDSTPPLASTPRASPAAPKITIPTTVYCPPPSYGRITEEELRAIDWFQFEKLMAELYRLQGKRVEHRGGANPDGGIDLITCEGDHRVAVQCKHWRVWNVGVRHLREFFGGMKAEGFDHGIFVTLCGYTGESKKFADENGITILNAHDIEIMLDGCEAHSKPEIRAILEDTTKYCPKCGAPMVLRTAERGPNPGSQFWGCSTYPRCFGKIRIDS